MDKYPQHKYIMYKYPTDLIFLYKIMYILSKKDEIKKRENILKRNKFSFL